MRIRVETIIVATIGVISLLIFLVVIIFFLLQSEDIPDISNIIKTTEESKKPIYKYPKPKKSKNLLYIHNSNIDFEETDLVTPVEFGCDITNYGKPKQYIIAATVKKPSGKSFDMPDIDCILEDTEAFTWNYLPIEYGKHYVIFGVWDSSKTIAIKCTSYNLSFMVSENAFEIDTDFIDVP